MFGRRSVEEVVGMRFRTSVAPWLLLAGVGAMSASCEADSDGDLQEETVAEAQDEILNEDDGPTPSPYSQSSTLFESGQVRPLAMTPDKKLLLATNTPDGKLEIFKIKTNGLQHVASVPVGI